MAIDVRGSAAKFYDAEPGDFGDLPFYIEKLPSDSCDVLELGCGTGRVLGALANRVGSIVGVDLSPEMLAVCRRRLEASQAITGKAKLVAADICAFSLERSFDLIIAPFRVIQNLETDSQLHGLFECIGKHLRVHGTCILNAFNPSEPWEQMARDWATPREDLEWEVQYEGGMLSRYCRRNRADSKNHIVYPDLIYRHRKDGILVEEAAFSISMRCYYPEEFEALVTRHGFKIEKKWGGYHGEMYGQGPELVIEFGR